MPGDSIEAKTRYQVDYAGVSQGENRQPENNGFPAKPLLHTPKLSDAKGQLFITAATRSSRSGGQDAAQMAAQIIRENYYSYPSNDIQFCLKRAFDIANRQIYLHAKANGSYRKFKASASALVVTDSRAYFAHIGDCRIYRVQQDTIELLTREQTRSPELPVAEPPPAPEKKTPAIRLLTRSLGLKLGVKVEVSHSLAVGHDDHFVLCSSDFKNITEGELKEVVLSAPAPQACEQLLSLARQRGGRDDAAIQIVTISNPPPAPPVEIIAEIQEPAARFRFRAEHLLVFLLLAIVAMLLYQPVRDNLLGMATKRLQQIAATGNEMLSDEETENLLLQRGEQYLDDEQWDQALEQFQAILRINEESPAALNGIALVREAYEYRGERAFRQKDWKNAALYYSKLVNLNPDEPHLQQRLAESRRNLEVRANLAGTSAAASRNSDTQPQRPPDSDDFSLTIVDGIQRAQWEMPGLYETEDYRLGVGYITFFDNLRIKKAFHQGSYLGLEAEASAKVLSASGGGRYGIIFGHDAEAPSSAKNFYIFLIDQEGQFILQHIAADKVKTLVSDPIKPGILSASRAVHLKVKSVDNNILLYANGELLKMVSLPQPAIGGVGMYVDPRMSVEFSRFKISPAQFR